MENDDLTQYLKSLQRQSCYRVDSVLKERAGEVTQRVFFEGSNGAEGGPYIRKFIDRDVGLGTAYERIFATQQYGKRFKHIPDILECYTLDEKLVVVMEFVQGETLQNAVDKSGASLEYAQKAFPQLCDAVSELHEEFDQPIIHRDIKPGNVIISDGGLVLIDFGIARSYREGAESDTNRFGTREYAAPEQFGFGQTSVRSDVYSLGLVLFFLITGSIPNTSQRERGFEDARIPEALRRVIAHASAFDPSARFGSVRELKAAFEDVVRSLQGESTMPSDVVDSHLPKTAAESAQPSWSGNENASDSVNRDTQDVQSEYSSHPSRSSKKRTARIAVVALIVLAIAAALFIAIQATHKTSSSSSDDTASSQSAVSATSLQSEEWATGESGAHSSSVKDDIAEDAPESLAQDMQNDKTPKNGFDERTNFIDSVAGVDFQIPSYFKASVIEDEKDSTYYYAERGYSVAMVHLRASKMDSDTTREDFEHFKDDYLKGFMDSSGFDQVLSYSDCELAGYAARIATLKGSLNDLPITIKLAYFFNPELQTVGSITLGQSSNVQFDYAIDFAKVITSATSPSQGNLEPRPLELVDSAYTASNGYLHYVAEIKNPNDGYCAEFATISVAGRSADGGIAFSHDWVVGGIAPGTVTYWPDICGKGEVTGDEEITIEVSVDKINWKRTAGSSSGNPYRFDNVSAKREEYTGLAVTGEITLMEEVEDKTHNGLRPMIVCALKDDSGKLVGGFKTFSSRDLQLGKPTAFQFNSHYDVPEYTVVEMSANPWGV